MAELTRGEGHPFRLRRVGVQGTRLRYIVEQDGILAQLLTFDVTTQRGADLIADASASYDGRACAVTLLRRAAQARPELAAGDPRAAPAHLAALAKLTAAKERGHALEAIRRYEGLSPIGQADPEAAMATLWAAMRLMDERRFGASPRTPGSCSGCTTTTCGGGTSPAGPPRWRSSRA